MTGKGPKTETPEHAPELPLRADSGHSRDDNRTAGFDPEGSLPPRATGPSTGPADDLCGRAEPAPRCQDPGQAMHFLSGIDAGCRISSQTVALLNAHLYGFRYGDP